MDTSSEPFLYTGQSSEDIPRNVTRVKVDPSVKEIGNVAFFCCRQLIHVDLCEGLERIAQYAFYDCTSLERIAIPTTVKSIEKQAFSGCEQLMTIELCAGLECIDQYAFSGCISLQYVSIPSTVKVVGQFAFYGCTQLIDVALCDGLERIDEGAWYGCTSLQRVTIPSTVKVISKSIFGDCRELTSVELCEGLESIEDRAFANCISLNPIRIPSTVNSITNSFVDCNSLRTIEFSEEYNQFLNEVSLHDWLKSRIFKYNLFTRWNLPKRFGKLSLTTGKMDIRNMLSGTIPSIASYKLDDQMNAINLHLVRYEQVQECLTTILEHVIARGADVIIPLVLSFL